LSPNDALSDLFLELDRTHTAAYYQSDEFRTRRDFLNFATAANGEVRNFYEPARRLLAILTAAIYEQYASFKKHIDEKRFAELVRQVVVDLHASEALAGAATPLQCLVDELTERVDKASQSFTHSFPAWTCGVEDAGAWTFGPVTFMTWPQWLTRVDFSDQAKASVFLEPEANARWKELLLEAMKDRNAPAPTGLARLLVGAVTTCPAVLRVEVGGLDKNLSRKLGEIVCKGALDAVSLLIGQRQSFVQQALQVERLPPTGIDSIVESSGYLWLPGTSLTDRIPSLKGASVQQFLQDFPSELQAMAHAINGLLDCSHPHPQLASRWATALDWYAEGQRERSDAIALAKFGTSLDVLASGGKFAGILNLLTNLLGLPENAALTRGTKQSTLRRVVKDIYDSGRSQILHGNRHDRMEAFESDRNAAAYFARLALIEAALRLKGYTGADEAKSFRTMPSPLL
tara:strand:- start:87320 stop:88696 length:1377 start_codon:yes stop_codon:yes gene_type:complete